MDSTGRVTIEVLERVRSGAPEGLEDFVRLFGPKILAFIRYRLGERLGGKVEAEDVLQDFFAALVEHRGSFLDKVDQRGVHRTVYRMVENHIKDLYEKHFQTQKRAANLEIREGAGSSASGGFSFSRVAGPGSSISARIEAQDEYKSLERILTRLDAGSQRLFVLKYLEECTNQEIADELGTSLSSVKRMTAELVERIQKARKG